MVAPDREVSACSQSLTLKHPLRADKIAERTFAVDGTPADCVNLAVVKLLPRRARPGPLGDQSRGQPGRGHLLLRHRGRRAGGHVLRPARAGLLPGRQGRDGLLPRRRLRRAPRGPGPREGAARADAPERQRPARPAARRRHHDPGPARARGHHPRGPRPAAPDVLLDRGGPRPLAGRRDVGHPRRALGPHLGHARCRSTPPTTPPSTPCATGSRASSRAGGTDSRRTRSVRGGRRLGGLRPGPSSRGRASGSRDGSTRCLPSARAPGRVPRRGERLRRSPRGASPRRSSPPPPSRTGAKPCPSREALSLKLMKIWEVRVLGPAVAKVTVPRRFDSLTGSSLMLALCQAAATSGWPWMPNCTMNPEMTRKKVTSSKKPALARLKKRSAPRGAQARVTSTTNGPLGGLEADAEVVGRALLQAVGLEQRGGDLDGGGCRGGRVGRGGAAAVVEGGGSVVGGGVGAGLRSDPPRHAPARKNARDHANIACFVIDTSRAWESRRRKATLQAEVGEPRSVASAAREHGILSLLSGRRGVAQPG